MNRPLKRREFLKTGVAIASAPLLGRRLAAAPSLNGKLRNREVGVGGMGGRRPHSISSHASVEVARCATSISID